MEVPLMGMTKNLLALFVLVLFVSEPIYPQQSTKPSSRQREKKKDRPPIATTDSKKESADILAEKRFAQGQLEVLAGRAKSLDNSILKVNVVSKVADGLWEYDETRARQLFIAAFQ